MTLTNSGASVKTVGELRCALAPVVYFNGSDCPVFIERESAPYDLVPAEIRVAWDDDMNRHVLLIAPVKEDA